MARLYSGGILQLNQLESALRSAKTDGKLEGFPQSKITRFIDAFRRAAEKLKNKVGEQLSYDDVLQVMSFLETEEQDGIYADELRKVKTIIDDRDFEF